MIAQHYEDDFKDENQRQTDLRDWIARYLAEDISLQEFRALLASHSGPISPANMTLRLLDIQTRSAISDFEGGVSTREQLSDSLAHLLAWIDCEDEPDRRDARQRPVDPLDGIAIIEATPCLSCPYCGAPEACSHRLLTIGNGHVEPGNELSEAIASLLEIVRLLEAMDGPARWVAVDPTVSYSAFSQRGPRLLFNVLIWARLRNGQPFLRAVLERYLGRYGIRCRGNPRKDAVLYQSGLNSHDISEIRHGIHTVWEWVNGVDAANRRGEYRDFTPRQWTAKTVEEANQRASVAPSDCPFCGSTTQEGCRHGAASWDTDASWGHRPRGGGPYGSAVDALAERVNHLRQAGWSAARIESAILEPRIIGLLRTAFWTAEGTVAAYRGQIDWVGARAGTQLETYSRPSGGTGQRFHVYHPMPAGGLRGWREWVTQATAWLDAEEGLIRRREGQVGGSTGESSWPREYGSDETTGPTGTGAPIQLHRGIVSRWRALIRPR